MRIKLDRTVCDGFGACAKHAPEYFSLDDWGYANLIGDGIVPDADHDAVQRALLDCPVHAIIAIGEHQPFGGTNPLTDSEETAEPHVLTENSEAISGFIR